MYIIIYAQYLGNTQVLMTSEIIYCLTNYCLVDWWQFSCEVASISVAQVPWQIYQPTESM